MIKYRLDDGLSDEIHLVSQGLKSEEDFFDDEDYDYIKQINKISNYFEINANKRYKERIRTINRERNFNF